MIHFLVPGGISDTEPPVTVTPVTNKIILSYYVLMFIIERITPYFMLVPSLYEKSQYEGGIHYLSAELIGRGAPADDSWEGGRVS